MLGLGGGFPELFRFGDLVPVQWTRIHADLTSAYQGVMYPMGALAIVVGFDVGEHSRRAWSRGFEPSMVDQLDLELDLESVEEALYGSIVVAAALTRHELPQAGRLQKSR